MFGYCKSFFIFFNNFCNLISKWWNFLLEVICVCRSKAERLFLPSLSDYLQESNFILEFSLYVGLNPLLLHSKQIYIYQLKCNIYCCYTLVESHYPHHPSFYLFISPLLSTLISFFLYPFIFFYFLLFLFLFSYDKFPILFSILFIVFSHTKCYLSHSLFLSLIFHTQKFIYLPLSLSLSL